MMKLSILIEARERVTGPLRRVRAALRGMATEGGRDADRLTRSLDRVRGMAGRVGGAMKTAAIGGIAAAGTGMLALGGGMLKVASDFEQMQVQLETALGSAAKAESAMAWIRQFAKKTPYELAEVTAAFVTAKGQGIDPFSGAMTTMGNAAGGAGKSIEEAILAVGDAMRGENERLKSFQIDAAAQGSNVMFTYYDRAGKKLVKSVEKDQDKIKAALLGIFDERFSGGMDRMSRTMSGMVANLKDNWTGFLLSIANAGSFDYIKGRLTALLGWTEKVAQSGKLDAWAKRISDGIVRFAKALEGFDWRGLAADIGSIARVFGALAGVIWTLSGQSLANLFDIAVIVTIAKMAMGVRSLALSFAFLSAASAPITLTILAVAGLAAGAYLLIRNWSKVKGFFAGLWKSLQTSFREATSRIWNSLPSWFRGILTGAKFAINVMGNLFSGGSRPAAGAPAPARSRLGPVVSGHAPAIGRKLASAEPMRSELRIRVDGPPGTRPTVTAMRPDPRQTISVHRGGLLAG